jgi:hypothetical protein
LVLAFHSFSASDASGLKHFASMWRLIPWSNSYCEIIFYWCDEHNTFNVPFVNYKLYLVPFPLWMISHECSHGDWSPSWLHYLFGRWFSFGSCGYIWWPIVFKIKFSFDWVYLLLQVYNIDYNDWMCELHLYIRDRGEEKIIPLWMVVTFMLLFLDDTHQPWINSMVSQQYELGEGACVWVLLC